MGRYTARIHRRTVAIYGMLVLLFSGLFVRLGQLSSAENYLAAAETQRKYTLSLTQSRGFFYDCDLQPLVNEEKVTVYAIAPGRENLAAVLQSVSPERRQSVAAQMEGGRPFLLESDFPLQAEGVVELWRYRRSDDDLLAPHLIGYLQEGSGASGLEHAFEEELSSHGTAAKVTYTLNGIGQSIEGEPPAVSLPEEDDYGVVLTIDKELQALAEEIGGQYLEKGAIVVMDPQTGEIKAAASFPSYTASTLAEAVADSENTPLINRVFSPYSVGSTFKVVTAAAALEQGSDLTETVVCEGYTDVSGRIFRCHRRSGHGEVDLLDAMAESCNPYFIELGASVGGETLLGMAKRLGFGQGYVFGEGVKSLPGSLPTLSDLSAPAELANFSFGQGKLTATPLQLAVMMSAVCNGGFLITPKLVLGEYQDGQLKREPTAPQERVLSAEVAAQLQALLVYSVMVKEGQNSLPETVSAGGKTATAQTGRYDETGDELEHGWFAGFFPAADPEYVVVVLAEEAGGGNNTASPVFAALADAVAGRE